MFNKIIRDGYTTQMVHFLSSFAAHTARPIRTVVCSTTGYSTSFFTSRIFTTMPVLIPLFILISLVEIRLNGRSLEQPLERVFGTIGFIIAFSRVVVKGKER